MKSTYPVHDGGSGLDIPATPTLLLGLAAAPAPGFA